MKTTPENFSSVVFADIQQIVDEESGRAEAFVGQMADSARRRVIDKSPEHAVPYATGKRRPGRYKRGWIVKREIKNGYRQFIVTNKNDPTLTHILEFGTAQRTTKAGQNRGCVKKHPHIRAAYDETVAEYAQKKI